MNKKLVIAGIIGVIIGFALGTLIFKFNWFGSYQDKEETLGYEDVLHKYENTNNVSVSNLYSPSNVLVVDSQAPGEKVLISEVTLETPGWVAIHEDREGVPGNILGAAWFPAGTFKNIEVDVLRNTLEGKLYYAMIHSDDGDRKFNHKIDLPIKDPSGDLVMMSFTAISNSKK